MNFKRLRRQRLIDARLQFSVAWSMGAALLIVTVAYAVTFYLTGGEELLPSSESAQRASMVVAGVYFLAALVVTITCAALTMHRVAGPVMLIERAIRGMRVKDYGQRLTLRDHDHLHSLAAEVSALRDEMSAADADRAELLENIADALAAEHYDEAKRLCAQQDGDEPTELEEALVGSEAGAGKN